MPRELYLYCKVCIIIIIIIIIIINTTTSRQQPTTLKHFCGHCSAES